MVNYISYFIVPVSWIQLASGGWIDSDTPKSKRTTKSLVDGTEYNLVMSDEFNVEGRSLKDGHDPMWTALDKSDDDSSSAGGGSLHFYNSSSVTTEKGFLKIKTSLGKTEWNRFNVLNNTYSHEETFFKSGMVQSWDKFCFTGGILEVDIIFPGSPYVGGLWPAVWMLGNLGRATYEASTNMIWPWSYDTCNRTLQPAQTLSSCNNRNHFGMNANQGRGATEIDLIEVMAGNSHGFFENTNPGVGLPYADMTLQVAPGITKNRPQSGKLPAKKNASTLNPYIDAYRQNWYEGLEHHGNTSINPFFYGTYLGETKPQEPVQRTKKEAFQADAVGVMHQLTPWNFNKSHTFRLEWQPGTGGRLDWFTKGYKTGEKSWTTGDGNGQDWVPVFSIKDESLKKSMGSQIPIEPSYLILNTAVSSTWGFPSDVPSWCPNCFDCDDPKCACQFNPGFCQMVRTSDVSMYIDYIRVYQSTDPSAHVGANHTVGCDPPEFPTKDWIEGHEYRYMRNPPFSFKDTHPIKKVQRGGASCKKDSDCGGNVTNLSGDDDETNYRSTGKCVDSTSMKAMFSSSQSRPKNVCKCNEGYTGPNCRAQQHTDDSVSAQELRHKVSPLKHIARLHISPFLLGAVLTIVILFVITLVVVVVKNKNERNGYGTQREFRRPVFVATEESSLLITGTSI